MIFLKKYQIIRRRLYELIPQEIEIFYQIKFNQEKHELKTDLFTEDLDQNIDFKIDNIAYENTQLKNLFQIIKNNIQKQESYILTKLYTAHCLHKRTIQWKLNSKIEEDVIVELNNGIFGFYKEENKRAVDFFCDNLNQKLMIDYKYFDIAEINSQFLKFPMLINYSNKLNQFMIEFLKADSESIQDNLINNNKSYQVMNLFYL